MYKKIEESTTQITEDMLKKFKKNYNDNPINKIIENSITENGIEKAALIEV